MVRHARRSIVLLLGWRDPPPVPLSLLCECRGSRELFVLSLDDYRLVVLGDSVLDDHDALRGAALLRRKGLQVWLSPRTACYVRVLEWARTGVGPVICRSRLQGSVHAFVRRASVHAVEPNDWLRLVPGARLSARALQVVRAIPELTDFSVGELAAALSLQRRELTRLCRRELEATPRDVLWSYRIARARGLRSLGLSMEAIAQEIGLSSARALRRALKSRGESLPESPCPNGPPACPNGPLAGAVEPPDALSMRPPSREVAAAQSRQGGAR